MRLLQANTRSSVLLLLVLLAAAPLLFANDSMNEDIRRQGELREAKMRYRSVSSQRPTDENILATLDTGRKDIEVHLALDVAAQDSGLRSGIPLRTLLALGEPSRDASVRVASARILLDRDEFSAIPILKAVLRSELAAGVYRMQAAEALLAEGDLHGYPVVKAIFLGKHSVEAMAAAYYLVQYLPFEGRRIEPGKAARIDARASAAKAASEPRRLFDLYAGLENQKRKAAAGGSIGLTASLIGLSPDSIRIEWVLWNRGFPEIEYQPEDINDWNIGFEYAYKSPDYSDGNSSIYRMGSRGIGALSHQRPFGFAGTTRLRDGEAIRRTLSWPLAVFDLKPEESASLDCAGIDSLLSISVDTRLQIRKPGEVEPYSVHRTTGLATGSCREFPE